MKPITAYKVGQSVTLGGSLKGFTGKIANVSRGATPQKENREAFYYEVNTTNGQRFTVRHSEIISAS